MKTTSKVWLVTGVSSGLGHALAKSIHQSGDVIVGTVRKAADQADFEAAFPGRSKVFCLDLTDLTRIEPLVAEVLSAFGRIDVLVNNAGYGLFGLVEEVSTDEVRHQLDTNFVAVWKMTQAVLPAMRRQRSGHIIQVSSRLGIMAGAGNGLYAAGKFALEGFSEALAAEVAPFGIQVTLAEPGPLRTDFFGRSVVFAQQEIQAYLPAVGNIRQKSKQLDGKQPGDPAKVAEALVQMARLAQPPFRLPFTQATLDALQHKSEAYQQTVREWKELATSVTIPA
jgi:NAD(P)-dependent dehydrogenase (short-subunit alcohol dehydrogenase family)